MQGNVWAWVLCRTINRGVAKLLALKQNEEPPQQGGTRSRPSAGFLLWHVARYDKQMNPLSLVRELRQDKFAARGPRCGYVISFVHSATNASRLISLARFRHGIDFVHELLGALLIQCIDPIGRSVALSGYVTVQICSAIRRTF